MDLLALHAKIMDELRARNIVRSSNNPVGDVAETLFCRAFGWKQSGNSSRSVDAIGRGGKRYQIKGRRLSRLNASRQMSAIRNLDGAPFDFLAGVLFAADYTISSSRNYFGGGRRRTRFVREAHQQPQVPTPRRRLDCAWCARCNRGAEGGHDLAFQRAS